jgi:uncharacterized membrane protein
MAAKPRPDDYPTRASYRWALRHWKRAHGGSLLAVLAIALVFGGLSGSAVAVVLLVAVAVGGWLYMRSRP